jgi:hypothetical protein
MITQGDPAQSAAPRVQDLRSSSAAPTSSAAGFSGTADRAAGESARITGETFAVGRARASSSAAPLATASSAIAMPSGVAPSTSADRAPRDGVEAAGSIDWGTVRRYALIPRIMPTHSAALAIDAGFALEWFENSIGDGEIDSIGERRRFSSTPFLPLIERIVSEVKRAEDTWANGLESDLHTLIQQNTPSEGRLFRACSVVRRAASAIWRMTKTLRRHARRVRFSMAS